MNKNTIRPIIGITMGDPLGIGPEIIVRALAAPQIYDQCKPLIIGDPHIMGQALKMLDSASKLHIVEHPDQGLYQHPTLDILALSNLTPEMHTLKAPTSETGRAMENYIIKGIDMALNGQISALVTAPITKTAMKLAGSNFHGHTELLAHQTRTDDYAMMLAGERLKVVLVTIHIPLAMVSNALTSNSISQTIQLTHSALQSRFNINNPRIGVAGFNPHSGESDMFGTEETHIILPAVSDAISKGIHAVGPLPPDTIFFQAVNGKFDAVICMYHDQGLIPFKLIHFKDGVNTTLGLPIIRTSVDHGTAYDIAWKGIADETSMAEAIKMAAFQANNAAD